jgi:CheY-like chemotaxis protein
MKIITSARGGLFSPGERSRAVEHSRASTLSVTSDRNGIGLAVAPLRVLLVEDDPDTLESSALLVRLFGHEALTAANGPAALALARSRPPDVALLDLALGGPCDGLEVARRLRRQEGLEKVLLVAVTGYGDECHRRRCREAGFDEYLVKPVEPNELAHLLACWARSAPPGQ